MLTKAMTDQVVGRESEFESIHMFLDGPVVRAVGLALPEPVARERVPLVQRAVSAAAASAERDSLGPIRSARHAA
jgi:hypothetical protein